MPLPCHISTRMSGPKRGYHLSVPREYTCPGCGQAVQTGEDYVVAREYVEPDFSLHTAERAPTGAERRFHVEHFRRRLAERVFVLVREESTTQ